MNNIPLIISQILKCNTQRITNITPLKKGMTNHSYTFIYNEEKYILRIPGEGTNNLIDRQKEYDIYQKIAPLNIGDNVVYMNPTSGYKITKFWENARVCNPQNLNDVSACMATLRQFHSKKLQVNYSFCPFEKIEFYESLWNTGSIYPDYAETKAKVMSLKNQLTKFPQKLGLSHIDSVPDNFMFIENDQIRLIDWEYAAMYDQHIDIAMFAVYAMYDKFMVDQLIAAYFLDNKPHNYVYLYICVCGLLWSNWCEYKQQLGIGFGEYALKQYKFAQDYFAIFNATKDVDNG
ncbi:MAG: phosphotransferase family protein [Firmicutes bacterium]|nr:phosphotransferase family protein [Bacillota bacterium]